MIMDQNNIYDICGSISEICSWNTAVVKFQRYGRDENALMQKDTFYYNGQLIPSNENWHYYVAIDMLIKFNAHSNKNSTEYRYCDWCITICWPIKSNLLSGISIKTGFMHALGRVIDINSRRGISKIINANGQSYRILFADSNVYIHEKKFTGNNLREVLDIHDDVLVNAIPCMSDENDEGCEWFAIMVCKGKPPNLTYTDISNKQKSQLNIRLHGFWKSVYNSSVIRDPSSDFQLSLFSNDFKLQCLQFIQQHVSNTHTIFVSGSGIIMDILNDEFGLLVGEFKKNLFQTIIFHRQYVYLYKMNLKSDDLRNIFYCGDKMKFIAVKAPSGFLTDWIAVQISVFDNQKQKANVSE